MNPTLILFRSQRQPYIVSIVDLISLAPLLVQQLLELLVSDDLLVTVEDGHVEVGVVVAAIRPANAACGYCDGNWGNKLACQKDRQKIVNMTNTLFAREFESHALLCTCPARSSQSSHTWRPPARASC